MRAHVLRWIGDSDKLPLDVSKVLEARSYGISFFLPSPARLVNPAFAPCAV